MFPLERHLQSLPVVSVLRQPEVPEYVLHIHGARTGAPAPFDRAKLCESLLQIERQWRN